MSKLGIRAFVVTCHDDDHGATVVFAESGREARQQYDQSMCDCGYMDQRAKRVPYLDQYAPGPVSIITLMAHGWYAICANCENHVHEDDPFVHDGGDVIFCCQQCKDRHDEYWSEERRTRLTVLQPSDADDDLPQPGRVWTVQPESSINSAPTGREGEGR